MSMIMNHDITGLMGTRIMQKNSLAMKRSLEKLSSGLRTKIADVDNTAGLAISETMRSRIYGMDKALYNTEDGISMIQTANGGLEQTQSMLMRMRELSVQAANDVLTQQDRSYIQVEINELRDEITRIGSMTQFNRKNILSGDNAVLWNSTSTKVKAIINGGLRSIDNYGQKYAVDGNYKISVSAEAGKAQVQKSDVFKVKHENTIENAIINTQAGVHEVSVDGEIPSGKYTLKLADAEASSPIITGSYGIGQDLEGNFTDVSNVFNLTASDGLEVNANILFEVKNVDADKGVVTLKATAEILTQDGVSSQKSIDNILLEDGGEAVNLSQLFGENSFSVGLNGVEFVKSGAKFSVNVSAQTLADDAIGINLTGIAETKDPKYWDGATFNNQTVNYVLDGSSAGSSSINFRNFFVSDSGQVSHGTITLETEDRFKNVDASTGDFLASFDTSFVGKTATGNTKLRDIDKFWDANGKFLLEEPRELTLTQGDGQQARIMLNADDTMNDVARKLNDAIANGLGQKDYVDNTGNFATFVEGATTGLEGVEGTLVIRSVLPGAKGEITLSASEEVLHAFSLNTVQKADESRYNVTVSDAHSGQILAQDVKITGNVLKGVIHQNVDVEFDPMLGIKAAWNNSTKNFDLIETSGNNGDDVVLHLADNTTIFQTGAGEGEDVMISIGDMRAHALGLDSVNIMSKEAAGRSISIIDSAIDRVSMQMAKLGAAQNRLEHHLGNLSDETEALVAANSRIRDTEYMSEMMEYARISILMQANTTMLAQSNQMQQSSILSLLR